MPLPIPPNATFRRAEGLTFLIDLCSGTERFRVVAERQGGARETSVSAEEAAWLGRLWRWQRADEVGAPHEALVSLVERDCAFWSSVRPARELTGRPLAPLEGKIALRANVSERPLVAVGDGLASPPFMPRRGSLDRSHLGGLVIASQEMGSAVGWVSVRCCPAHARLVRDLVPRLTGEHTVEALVAGDRDRAALLAALASLGWLERHDPPPRWDGKPRVTWMGHAAVLIEASGQRILVDPLFHSIYEPTRLPERPFDTRDLGRVDAVLVTHGDNDHLNPSSLMRLPRDTPIYVPSTPRVEPYQVDMMQLLWSIGCTRVVEVDPWQRVKLGDVTVVATPFRGEDWGLTLACTTFLVHAPDLTVFLNADSTSTPEDYARIRQEFTVDLAFLGVTGAAETYAMPPGYGYGDFYTPWLPKERHNEWVELCNGPRESAEAAALLEPRFAFGYAAGGTSFTSVSYCDRGTHGDLARLLQEAGGKARPLDLRPGVPTAVPPR